MGSAAPFFENAPTHLTKLKLGLFSWRDPASSWLGRVRTRRPSWGGKRPTRSFSIITMGSGTENPTTLHLWSGPRCVSTALMYSFRQRSDTKVRGCVVSIAVRT